MPSRADAQDGGGRDAVEGVQDGKVRTIRTELGDRMDGDAQSQGRISRVVQPAQKTVSGIENYILFRHTFRWSW
jgi:hypothetical protein